MARFANLPPRMIRMEASRRHAFPQVQHSSRGQDGRLMPVMSKGCKIDYRAAPGHTACRLRLNGTPRRAPELAKLGGAEEYAYDQLPR
jgi:hypothetical protein